MERPNQNLGPIAGSSAPRQPPDAGEDALVDAQLPSASMRAEPGLLVYARQPPPHSLTALIHPDDLHRLPQRRVIRLNRMQRGNGRHIPHMRLRQIDHHRPRSSGYENTSSDQGARRTATPLHHVAGTRHRPRHRHEVRPGRTNSTDATSSADNPDRQGCASRAPVQPSPASRRSRSSASASGSRGRC